jgi:hypothetical protein
VRARAILSFQQILEFEIVTIQKLEDLVLAATDVHLLD